ncbi:unnamed protein product [Urochloa humidicola]
MLRGSPNAPAACLPVWLLARDRSWKKSKRVGVVWAEFVFRPTSQPNKLCSAAAARSLRLPLPVLQAKGGRVVASGRPAAACAATMPCHSQA